MTQTASPSALLRSWRWRIFASTWLCYAGYYFCRKPFYISKAAFGASLGLDASDLGFLGAAYLFAYTAGQFASGWLGTSLGPRFLLLLGMGVSIASNIVFGLTNSFALFATFMVLNGLAQASGWPGTVGTMANWFRREERGTVMGLWSTNFQVGGVLANALSAWALGALGFRYSFFLGSAILLAVMVFFTFNQRNRPEDLGLPAVEPAPETLPGAAPAPKEKLRWSRNVLTNVLLIGVFYFFIKFIRYALWSWAPFFLTKNFALSGSDAGYLSTLFDLFGIFGVIATGWLSDRYFQGRRARISLWMIGVLFASCVLLYAAGIHSLAVFGVCLGLIGFSLYGPDALLSGAGAIDAGTPRGAALAAGIINGMGSVGSIVQELAIGRLYDSNGGALAPVFALLLGAGALSGCALLVINYRNGKGFSDI